MKNCENKYTGLTSRAQARGADDALRDSGTGLSRQSAATAEAAIPRLLAIYRSCLQRFVRQQFHIVQSSANLTSPVSSFINTIKTFGGVGELPGNISFREKSTCYEYLPFFKMTQCGRPWL
jgi:hypothetical protein